MQEILNKNLSESRRSSVMLNKIIKNYYVYILTCDNGSYYTGYTTDLNRRYQEHAAGTAKCKYTRSFKPLGIAQYWQLTSKAEAMKMERLIKQLSKKEKEYLVRYPEKLAGFINF